MKHKALPGHIEVGQLGESVAVEFLGSCGHLVIERNYRKKLGEIDIVSRETNGMVHFIEVKTVSYETRSALDMAVTRRTWRPEENVHESKLKKLHRTIDTWIIENRYEGQWQVDVLAVRIVPREKFASINYIENVLV
jgi:putative endonuclease